MLWLKRWASVEQSMVCTICLVLVHLSCIFLYGMLALAGSFLQLSGFVVKNEFKYLPVPSYVGVVILVINGYYILV